MADNFDPAKLTPLLECAICLRSYDNPVFLPCLHTFCSGCLEAHVSATKDVNGEFECPSCRGKCKVPQGRVEKFPKNFFANSLKDAVPSSVINELGSTAAPSQCKTVPQCDHHQDQKVDLYCKKCKVPICSYCYIKSHESHGAEQLSVVADILKEDLQDISKLVGKRIASLQQISRDLDTKKIQMEEELDQASKDISDTEENMHSLIKKHAATLQAKVENAREAARKYITEAQEEVKNTEENASKVEYAAQTLYADGDQFTFRTAVQTPGIKQQFLQQEQVPVPSIQWSMDTEDCEPGPVTTARLLGDAEMKMTDLELKTTLQADDGNLGAPLQTTKLQHVGKLSTCGLAPIHKTTLCVAHCSNEYIWVYSQDGQLKKKITIPGIEKIFGMVVLNGNQGALARASEESMNP